VSDVTVSIVNTNGGELLLDCLQSLAGTQADVVVLDNASEDGSVAAVRDGFPHVRVIAQEFRAGFGANHNRVIRTSSATYVLVLNEDTLVPEGTIEGLVAYLDEHPDVAVAGPLIRGFDGRQQGSAWRVMTVPVQLAWALTLGQFGAVQSRGSRPRRVGAVAAGAALYRRSALERVGLFDEGYFMFGEEGDLARRWEEIGLERHYVPIVEILHAGQHSTSKVPERQINEVWRSMDRYLSRWHSPFGRRTLTWLTGAGYALAVVASEVGRRLPARLRPAAAATWNPGIYRLHVRNAFRGVRDPGMRELADAWNQASSNNPAGEVSSASVSSA
jgi:GT2 family glycosyltransferase